MKNTIKILSIVAILFSGSLFAQDSLQVQKRNGNMFKKQHNTNQ